MVFCVPSIINCYHQSDHIDVVISHSIVHTNHHHIQFLNNLHVHNVYTTYADVTSKYHKDPSVTIS
jgi:hypothetical protein